LLFNNVGKLLAHALSMQQHLIDITENIGTLYISRIHTSSLSYVI